MNKYKIAVYAISKNEENFVNRWYDSVKEADEIYVLDTGSTDNTVKKLKENNVNVTIKKIEPWRFDVARNISLELIPDDVDICVCIDLDEVLEKGWRNKLEQIWNKNTDRLRYNYNWSFDENGKPNINFYIEKIHTKKNYKWTHPVHEVLTYTKNDSENFITTDEITVNHFPDTKKSRSNYLPLLELSVKEDPYDDRNMHYLGREYMYYGRWNESIDTLIKHLKLKTATWKDERCASMRFIARNYINLKRYDEAKMWLDKAINEAPYLRDPYIEKALLENQLQEWQNCINNCLLALKIDKNPKSYINEPFSWNHTIYDLLSVCYYHLGEYDKAYKYVNKALKMSDDKRILNNKLLIENKLKRD